MNHVVVVQLIAWVLSTAKIDYPKIILASDVHALFTSHTSKAWNNFYNTKNRNLSIFSRQLFDFSRHVLRSLTVSVAIFGAKRAKYTEKKHYYSSWPL
jgi:hypothetical protein